MVVHGGSFFSSGNDLSKLVSGFSDPAKGIEEAKIGVLGIMVEFLTALVDLEKPSVALVSGAAVGIACTMLGLFDFVYATPNAYFLTPFMSSFQSPEGGSTLTFPSLVGKRLAAEMLLCDKRLVADEAVKHGFINGIVGNVQFSPEGFFDLSLIPVMKNLVQNDVKTVVNAKRLLNVGLFSREK